MDVLKWFEETSSDDNRWYHVTIHGTLQLLSPNNKVCHSNKHHHCNETVTCLNLYPTQTRKPLHFKPTMNSLENAYQIRISNDSNYTSEPPKTLGSSSPQSPPPCSHELDCSRFDSYSSSTTSSTTSSSMYSQSSQQPYGGVLVKGFGITLSRSRCMTNLSSLGSVATETSIPLQLSGPTHYESGPDKGSWGYFVDSVME